MERRKVIRTRVIDSQLITVDLGDGNSGLLVDAAEWGLAVQGIASPPVGSERTISFVLPGGNVKISAVARVVWKDDTNQMGMHLVEISELQRKVLRKWLDEVEHEATAALLEWDAQSSGKAVIVPDEKVEPPAEKVQTPRAEPVRDPFAPPKREPVTKPTYDPFAPVKREVFYPPTRFPEPTPTEASPVATAAKTDRGPAKATLTEYEEPRYYPASPPATKLPEGAVATVPEVIARVPIAKPRLIASSPRVRFERWVIEKHEGSALEKVKTAIAVLLMFFGLWLFIKLLPPIATELKYDWNKFANAFGMPTVGDGLTGPPIIPKPGDLPTFSTSGSGSVQPAPSNSVDNSTGVTRFVRRSTPSETLPNVRAAAPSGGIYVPSFGTGTASYRLRLPDGVAPGRLLYQVQPVYPEVARGRKPDPRVSIRAVVDTKGKVVGAEGISGDPVLTAAAIRAIRQWRYEPYRVSGKPIEVETRIDLNFSALR